ncbi:MAG TPA: hypothetical protein VGF29_14765 [Hyphomicrobiaceae bacterium]
MEGERPLRGARYADGADPEILKVIRDLRDAPFEVALEIYEGVVPHMSPDELALLGCNDRFYLLTVLCNRPDMSHPWIYQRCREVEKAPDGYIDLWARAHGKSSVITFAGVIQEVLCDPETRVAIFSNTKELAHRFVDQIKTEFEDNAKLIALYPDVLWRDAKERKQARTWSVGDGITVKRRGNPREATVEGHGVVDAMPTGKHFPLLVYDDVINEANVTNPEQVKKATERTELSFSLGEAEGTRKWFIGTRYHFGDTYAYILENEIATPRIHPATEDGSLTGKPVFLSQARWDEIKRQQRSSVAAQYLQNPLAGEENMFLTRWLVAYWLRPAMLNVYIMVDPAKGRNKTSDRTAMVVIGIDRNENRHLLDGFCHRMPLSERWERLRDLHKKWSKIPGVQLVEVGYERYGMQSDVEYIEERQRIERYFFGVKELNWTGERPGGESKKARVGRLEPMFREGSFLVPGRVWHPTLGNAENHARWHLEDGSDEIKYRPDQGLDREERNAKTRGEHHRLMEPIMRRDEDGNPYDLTRVFFEEFALFPFSPRDDLLDAMSRISDMDARAPLAFEQMQIEVEDWADA